MPESYVLVLTRQSVLAAEVVADSLGDAWDMANDPKTRAALPWRETDVQITAISAAHEDGALVSGPPLGRFAAPSTPTDESAQQNPSGGES